MILLAIHQGILVPTDLHNLAIGEPFTVGSLVAARENALGARVPEMYVLWLCKACDVHPIPGV